MDEYKDLEEVKILLNKSKDILSNINGYSYILKDLKRVIRYIDAISREEYTIKELNKRIDDAKRKTASERFNDDCGR